MEIVRTFGSHHGNIGGVVPSGRIVIDIDPRNGGLESVATLTGMHGPFHETPTVKTGGGGLHNYFLLPEGVTVPSGGSLAASGYPGVEWKGDDRKRESLAAQVKRRDGQYSAFDNRSVNGHVRFLTYVLIPGAAPVEDIDSAVFEALRDVDLFKVAEGKKQRVHLVWLSQGWSLPAHESKGTVKTIAYKREVEPVDDAKEEEQARQMGLETWHGIESGDLEQWGNPRYFAVPQERLSELGPELAFNDLLEFAQRLGYQPVRDVRARVVPEQGRR